MCVPVVAAVAAVAAIAGGVSAYQQSAANKAQANYQAAVATNNATMAEYARKDTLERGEMDAIRSQQEARRLRGTQVARLASNGLDISSGTPLAILDETDFFSQRDAAMIRNNAARAAWGYQVEQQNLTSSSEMLRATARAEKPWQSAGLSLLGSAGQFAGAMGGGNPRSPNLSSSSRAGNSTMNTTGGFSSRNIG